MTMAVDLLVVGGTGLAGRAIVAAARQRGLSVRSLARTGDLRVDIRDADALRRSLTQTPARTIVNAAAMVSLPACEQDPAAARMVNARPAAIIAAHADATATRFVQVSTDHYYCGDGRRAHSEDEPVVLVNEYSRTKYAAEALTLTAAGSLIVRTNFVGWPSTGGTSFAEWAMGVIAQDAPADLFDDQFVSSLDLWTFADSLLDLAEAPITGVVNLAASEVFSKADFVTALASGLGRTLSNVRHTAVKGQSTKRADSLGLDVSKATRSLGRDLPTLDQVIKTLVAHSPEWRP